MTTQTCQITGQQFQVSDFEKELLQKISPSINKQVFELPLPNINPEERLRHRLAFYNRRHLYKRTSDYSGQTIISVFSPDKPFKAYETRTWYSDDFDPIQYGQPYDFTRPFFQQFYELLVRTPQNALATLGDNINSEFTNDNYKLKNCYLVFDGEEGEDCYYGQNFARIKNCIDFMFLVDCELCYECLHCVNCYDLKFSSFSQNCSSSYFLQDCIGCKHCFGCINLRNKEYCIYNKQYTKEEYENFISNSNLGSYKQLQFYKQEIQKFFLTQPRKENRNVNVQNVTGDNLTNCKNIFECYDCLNLEESLYCMNMLTGGHTCLDVFSWGNNIQNAYNCAIIGDNLNQIICSSLIGINCSNIFYSSWCTRNCHNLFGCFGLKQKSYCILNKQYIKEEFEEIVPKIIQQMQQDQTWGTFFPPEISPFGYNESLAQERMPLSKEEVLNKKWKWCDFKSEIQANQTLNPENLPDHIQDINPSIINDAILCPKSNIPFKITAQELKFYQQQNLPLPRLHHEERYKQLLAKTNPWHLYNRACAKSGNPILTPYSPDRPEIVYSEQAYNELVYG